MKTLTPTILLLWTTMCIAQPISNSITREQALKDLEILQTSLREIHPNVYRYTTKAEFDHAVEKVRTSLTHKITVIQFYRLIAPIIALVRCGHTFGITSFVDQRSGLLPLDIKILGNQMYVLRNFSNNQLLSEGSQIVKINGTHAHDLLVDFRSKSIGDGYNTTFKDRTIENDFRWKYATFINQPDNFEIELKDSQTNKIKTFLVAAISNELIVQKKEQENRGKILETPLNFLIDTVNNVAVLTVRSFMAKQIKKDYGQNLKQTIKASFRDLKRKNVRNLIIDIRHNTGGKAIAPTLLFSYLTNTDFRFGEKILFRHGYKFSYPEQLNRNKLNDWVNRKLDRKINDSTYQWTLHRNTRKLFKAQRNAFSGELYIIVNGMTASAGAEFASLASAHRIGTIVGEETGGDYNGVNGFDRTYLELPHSKIGVLIAGWRGVMAWEQNAIIGHGVVPNYEVQPTMEDLLNEQDTEMQFTYDLIKATGTDITKP